MTQPRLGAVLTGCLASLAVCGGLSACKGSQTSTSATTVPPAAPSPAPPTGGSSQAFAIDLPIAPGDSANAAFGIWPFGVHGGSHAADGHPGFDVEFRPGAQVRAAADGTIQNLLPDGNVAGRFTIRISHAAGSLTYATDYTNIGPLADGISAGTAVTRGQALGAAGAQTQFIGSSLVTWAITHFQVNDFTRNEGLTNPNAVSPIVFLSPGGRALFDSLWLETAYAAELTEPLATNDRATAFPTTRAWTTTDGVTAARIDFTRSDPRSSDHTYALRTATGDLIEAGTVVTSPHGSLSLIDLIPGTGPPRLGVYDIVDRSLRLGLGEPGAPRPATLAGARVYSAQ